MDHKVHKSKKGLYVIHKRRKFFPTGPTEAVADDKVYVYEVSGSADVVKVSKTSYAASIRTVHYQEEWTTTEKPPQIRERLKDGQVNITLGTASLATAVVGHEGFNYGKWRRAPTNKYSQSNSSSYNVLIPVQIVLNWDQWDELVEKITEARSLCEIGPIVTKLEDEIKAQDEFDSWLEEKGLVASGDQE